MKQIYQCKECGNAWSPLMHKAEEMCSCPNCTGDHCPKCEQELADVRYGIKKVKCGICTFTNNDMKAFDMIKQNGKWFHKECLYDELVEDDKTEEWREQREEVEHEMSQDGYEGGLYNSAE